MTQTFQTARVAAPWTAPATRLHGALGRLSGRLLAFLSDRGQEGDQDGEDRSDQERQRDRAGDEDRRIAPRDDHRATEVLLQKRSEHEAEQKWGRLAPELQQEVAQDSEEGDRVDVVRVETEREGPDASEGDDRRKEHTVRDREHLHPDPDQRHVEEDEE